MGSVLVAVCAFGQDRETEMFRELLAEIVEEAADGGNVAGMEDIVDFYSGLLRNPLDVNRASRSELERLGLLTDFQVESLMEYRKRHGDVLSATELQLVHGFNRRVVELLRPFISFDGKGEGYGPGRYKSTLLVKFKGRERQQNHIGEPFYSQLKYVGEIPGKFRTGFLLEKDYGEKAFAKGQVPLGDFLSFHVMARSLGIGKKMEVANVLLGDYTARFGQGLVVWNAFSPGGSGNVQGAFKRGNAIMPYSSSDENRFFRGGAVTLKRKTGKFTDIEATGFFSLKNVDAVIKEGKYTSLPDDGLHNTAAAMARRKTLGEMVYGGNVLLRMEKAKVGLNYLGYGYSMHNGRRVQDYNRYQMYDGMYGNFSVDAAVLVGKVRGFGELAVDYGAQSAFLCGALMRLGGLEASVVLRNYQNGYIAPYAGALSSSSTCSNQNGVSVVVQREHGGRKLSGGGEFAYYPWKRYNVDTSSSSNVVWVKHESLQESGSWNIKLYGKWGSPGQPLKLGVKGMYGRQLCSWLELKARGEAVVADWGNAGVAVAMLLKGSFLQDRLQLLFNGSYHNCREWDCRIYMYEYDLPSTYSSSLMYGSGFSWYSMLSFGFGNSCSTYLKACSDSEIKIGLRVRFF